METYKYFGLGLGMLLVCLAASGCGSSPEELAATSAAETATAVTDTPVPTPTQTPTPTPTSIPYEISILVIGEEDAPLVGAAVLLDEIAGSAGQKIIDDVGQAFWYYLPGETVNLTISAQGYFPQEISETLTRGVNQLTVKLERDPHGVLPFEACGPGEKLLYLEDFQDNKVQGWPEIDSRTQGWSLIPQPGVGNMVAQFSSDMDGTQIFYWDGTFENAVWRISFMPHGKPETITFYWHGNPDNWELYTLNFFKAGMIFGRPDFSTPVMEWFLKEDEWQNLEISTFENTFEVWLDGIQVLKYTDPEPLPRGRMGLELWPSESLDTKVYFDNLSVCELSVPFVPLPPIEE